MRHVIGASSAIGLFVVALIAVVWLIPATAIVGSTGAWCASWVYLYWSNGDTVDVESLC